MLLYHGTSMAFLPSILSDGLKPRAGEVCLTDDFKLATVFAFMACTTQRILAQGNEHEIQEHYPIVIPLRVPIKRLEKCWEGYGYYYATGKQIASKHINIEGIRRWDYDEKTAQGLLGYLLARKGSLINK